MRLNETETPLVTVSDLLGFSPWKIFAECSLILEQKALLEITGLQVFYHEIRLESATSFVILHIEIPCRLFPYEVCSIVRDLDALLVSQRVASSSG